jgi:hypothetical protein
MRCVHAQHARTARKGTKADRQEAHGLRPCAFPAKRRTTIRDDPKGQPGKGETRKAPLTDLPASPRNRRRNGRQSCGAPETFAQSVSRRRTSAIIALNVSYDGLRVPSR